GRAFDVQGGLLGRVRDRVALGVPRPLLGFGDGLGLVVEEVLLGVVVGTDDGTLLVRSHLVAGVALLEGLVGALAPRGHLVLVHAEGLLGRVVGVDLVGVEGFGSVLGIAHGPSRTRAA